ncbi:hypothetical protein PI95_011890 [Hassallia byssoidea VB512170]|uniref:Uncharacterized protein n=1 Tax=Hassallia byssoidea VB512170 TaxID=1304833 RepID=A0A846H7D8_9CYAN|nr:hypothetical protein [Hassalia byssoidea]NEU73246.1 hypothetical protein [Hassalia byssoidea VB512170]
MNPSGSPVAHGGNHATCFKPGNPSNAVAPQDRAGSPLTTLLKVINPDTSSGDRLPYRSDANF